MSSLLKVVFKAGSFLFDNPLGRLAAAAVACLMFLTAFVAHERRIGAERAVTKIEKANAKTVAAGRRAVSRARDGRVPGQRDPWTRDN